MLVTTGRLRELAGREIALKKSTVSEALHASVTSSSSSYDVFLSHSSIDAELILGAKALLESYGFSVYVDWVDDPQLIRSRVNAVSASIIRDRMRSSKMLLYAHTLNASKSKWCPWELGYFDGLKSGNVFIFPIAYGNRSTFDGQEYLGLYPYVDEALDKAGRRKLWINSNEMSKPLSSAIGEVFSPL